MKRNVLLSICLPAAAIAALLWLNVGAQNPPPKINEPPPGHEMKTGMADQNIDNKYLTGCYATSLFEIELGRLISGTAGVDNNVKQFAQQMIDAHTQKNQQ